VPSSRIVAPNAAISADDEKSPVTGDYDSRPAKKYGEEYLFSFTEDEHKLKWWLWIVAILAGLFKLIRKKVNK
jgi:hypothetical protein